MTTHKTPGGGMLPESHKEFWEDLGKKIGAELTAHDGKVSASFIRFMRDGYSQSLMIDRILAEQILKSTASPGDAWQTMDSAPRDGSWVLIINTSSASHARKVREARWNSIRSTWGPFTTSKSVTHWQPLPAPLSIAQTGEE